MPIPHPRRRQVPTNAPPTHTTCPTSPLPIDPLSPSFIITGTPLRKGATFHASTSPSSSPTDPVLHIPSVPRRSQTCLEDLEAVTAGRRRMTAIISSIDRTLSSLDSTTPDVPEDLPLPRGMLNATVSDISSQSDASHPSRQSHRRSKKYEACDSALGSSLSSLSGYRSDLNMKTQVNTAITRSASVRPPRQTHCLSIQAAKQIESLIINPLLRERTLKEFHPLVRDLPRRINEKEILCLRDLEKTLVHLAPTRARSAKSYLDFCETSIQCIHTTVDHISERDQRRPTDVPYTNGYFLDLVGQIRQYASEVAATRERQATGEAPTEADCSSSEKITLQGGLSQTGRPARLAREKDGKMVSIGDGQPIGDVKDGQPATMKRSLSGQSLEDSVLRSMARRRRLAAGEVVSEPVPQVCKDCSRSFARVCDLRKHGKTHSRPWKCTEPTCKYATYGWPTQKERDRHVNDKHSGTPQWFDCLYNCSYRSKRESNCKQHMEKTHGWKYDRQKGKGQRSSTAAASTPQSPQMPTPTSIPAGVPTPITQGNSPFLDQMGWSNDGYSANGSVSQTAPYPGGQMDPNEDIDLDGLHDPLDIVNVGLNGFPSSTADVPSLGADYAYQPYGASPFGAPGNLDFPAYPPQPLPAQMNQAAGYQDIHWDQLLDLDEQPNAQLMTPNLSVEQRPYGSFSDVNDVSMRGAGRHHNLSPNGQADIMFTSPMLETNDELDESLPAPGRPTQDFMLFSSNDSSSRGSVVDRGFFDPMPSMEESQGQQNQYDDLVDLDELME